jgi:hypothetical protein
MNIGGKLKTKTFINLSYNGLEFLERVWWNLLAALVPQPFRVDLSFASFPYHPCRCLAQVNLVIIHIQIWDGNEETSVKSLLKKDVLILIR